MITKGHKGMKSMALLLVGAIFLVSGIVAMWDFHKKNVLAERAKHWSPHPVTILSAEVRPFTQMAEKRSEIKRFIPHIEYSYAKGEKTYTNSAVRPRLEALRSEAEARAIIQKYPVGSAVQALVNPQNPAEATLEPGGSESGTEKFVGALLAGIGLVVMISGVRGLVR